MKRVIYFLSFFLSCLTTSGLALETMAESNAVSVTNETSLRRLPTLTVEDRSDDLIGIADSGSRGTAGSGQLSLRPILRSGEVLETVPGLIITQHAGGGKANQYFLRGFNLDHGTDFLTTIDGMPLNLPSHGHGQGYSDMNSVIPELIQRVNYIKGVYDASVGDFSSAGSAKLEFYRILPESFATVEGGMYGHFRTVLGASTRVGSGNLLAGFELVHEDGPWVRGDDFLKVNGLLTWSLGNDLNGLALTVRTYFGKWNSSDQIASSAVSDQIVSFFDALDQTTGGHSQRHSLQANAWRKSDSSASVVSAWGFYYDLRLLSDFTYFLVDPARGDQFEQTDNRWSAGFDASHRFFGSLGNLKMENVFGLQGRGDWIRNGLYLTQNGVRISKNDSENGGASLSATNRQDDISELSAALYYENRTQWFPFLRTVAGLRGDLFYFNVASDKNANSGQVLSALPSPKLSIILGPWVKTEFYLQGGLGFHSDDARGVTLKVDPVTGVSTNRGGEAVEGSVPLVRTYGAELGARTLILKGLQSTLSLWWLDIDSELVFAGDAGTTEAGRPSRRYGIEFANFYRPFPWISLDADISFSHAEFRDEDPSGKFIPGSVEWVVSSGVVFQPAPFFSTSLRLRYFGPRPLIEDNSVRSGDTLLLNAQVSLTLNKSWTFTVEVLNLLNRKDHDIDYFYASRVRPGDPVVEQIHFHPVEPIQVRGSLTVKI